MQRPQPFTTSKDQHMLTLSGQAPSIPKSKLNQFILLILVVNKLVF
jgi:hypothetical protein